jgi:predicted RND superfamily exporter protein
MGDAVFERVLAFAGRRTRAIAAAAVVAAVGGVLLVSRVTFDANILRLLPRDVASVRSFEVFLRDFGTLDHLYIVFETTDAIGDHADFVNAYVDALRKAPEIESVDAQLFEEGKDWTYLSDRVLYLLGPQGATEALARFRAPKLEQELVHARELLSMPSADIKAMVQRDPLGLLMLLRDRMAREKAVLSFDPTQDGYVSADGRSRLVIVKPKGQPFDTDFCKALFARLASVEHEARRDATPVESEAGTVTVQAAGAYRVSLESERVIRREATVNAVGSLVLLLILVFAVFRTPWVMLFGSIPVALGAVLTLGINGVVKGSLSPATSGSAGMLFGLGIDAIVLLYMRYLEARRDGAHGQAAVLRTARTASSVALAQTTTAATFFALLFVDFPTLQDLGGLVGLGILLCCGFTLLLLPGFLSSRREAAGRLSTAPWLGRIVIRAATPIAVAGLVATAVLGAASLRLRIDPSLAKLQAHTSGTQLEQEIATRFSLPQDVLLVVNESERLEPLLAAERRLSHAMAARMPAVTVGGIGFMLPPADAQDAVARTIADSHLTVDGVRDELRAAGARSGFRPDTFEPFLKRLPTLLDPDDRLTYDGLVSHGLDPIVSRFVVHRGGRYAAVTYLYPPPTIDLDALAAIVRETDPGLQLTGIPVVNHDLARRFVPEFVKAIALGTAVVAALIYAVFRTVRHTLLTLVPTFVGFTWSAGLLALARVELDLFSLFAAVCFIGIAVDYGIYVVSRYSIEGPRDVAAVLTATGPAILVACAAALIGFGTLIDSSYGPLHVFGIVSLVTLTCCAIASLAFLPACLVLAERWSTSAR